MKDLKKIALYTLLLSCLLVSGCGKQSIENQYESSEENNGVDIYREFKTQYEGDVQRLEGFENKTYYSMGLWDSKSNYLHDTTIYLGENDSIDAFLSLKNSLGEQYNFTVVVFDNYEQIEFEVDGVSMKQCTVKIENGGDINMPIKISSLDNGKHELVFGILVNTYKTLTTEERLHTGSQDDALVCTAIVGNNEEVVESGEYLHVDTITARTNGIVLNKVDGKEYSIEVGNLDNNLKKCAIIVLDNFEQVNIFNDSDNEYKLIELNPDEEVIISLADYFDKIKEDGKEHEIFAICLCEMENEGAESRTVFISNRIIK